MCGPSRWGMRVAVVLFAEREKEAVISIVFQINGDFDFSPDLVLIDFGFRLKQAGRLRYRWRR